MDDVLECGAGRAWLALRGGCGVEGFHLALNLLARVLLSNFQVIARLQTEPNAGRGAKITRQPQGRVGGDGALAAHNLTDA